VCVWCGVNLFHSVVTDLFSVEIKPEIFPSFVIISKCKFEQLCSHM